MSNFLLAILLCYPVEYSTTTIIIEVDIDIWQRNTVRVKESLKQQVVLDWVNLRDTQTICHSRSCGRSTTGAYRHIEFFAGCADEILHDKEVAWETHRLHNVQLELQSLSGLVIEYLAIALVCAIHREFRKIVGLKLNTV